MALITPESNPVLAAAKASIAQVTSRAEATIAKQEKITKKAEDVSTSMEAAVVEQTEATQVINLHQEIADLKAQNQTIDVIEASGTIESLAAFQKDLVETSKEVVAAQNEVEEIQNRPVEGVIDYFSQLFSLMGPEDRLQAAEERQANLTNIVSTVAASTESVQRAVATTKRSKNVATIEAGQELIQAKGNEILGKVQLESLARNSDQLAAGMRADAQTLSFKLQANTLHNTAVNQAARERDQEFQEVAQQHQLDAYRDQAEARTVALETAKLNLETVRATNPSAIPAAIARNEKAVKDMADIARAEDLYIGNVQKAQAALGLPVEDGVIIIQRDMKAGSLKERAKYDAMNNMGTSELPTFGVTVGDAIFNTAKTGIKKSKPADLIELVKQTYLKDKDAKREKLPKDEAVFKSELNATGAAITKGWASQIKQGDSSNPYHAPPMAVLAEDYSAVSESKLYKAVLAPMEMKEFDAKSIYDAALAGIAAKTVSIEEAALGIEAVFDSAVEHNNSTWMFERAGLPVQDSYVAEIVEPPIFSGGTKGAAVGGTLAIAGLAATALVSLPVAAGVTALTAFGGAQAGGMFEQAYPLTDSTQRVQVMQTLTKLISDQMPTRSFFK